MREILRQRQAAIHDLQVQMRPRVDAELDRLRDEVAGVLDEPQAKKWQRRFDVLRARWEPEL